jgi:uncharacterized protein
MLKRLQGESDQDEADAEGAEALLGKVVGVVLDERRCRDSYTSHQAGHESHPNGKEPGVVDAVREGATDESRGDVAERPPDGRPKLTPRDPRTTRGCVVHRGTHTARIGDDLSNGNKTREGDREFETQDSVKPGGESESANRAEACFPRWGIVAKATRRAIEFDRDRDSGGNAREEPEEHAQAEAVATGNVGSRLLEELVRRGYEVTGIAQNPETLGQRAHVTPALGDVQNEDALAKLLSGHDAVIHSVKFVSTNADKVISAVKKARVPRLLVVGGAGSLEVAPGVVLVDSPTLPAEYKPEALAGAAFLNTLRGEKELDWTFLSPSAMFAPGKRTGKFRVGKDQLLIAADGRSHISMEDYAIALVDELEHPQHMRERFTVGY